ncbi:AAA family ATPase [Erwinia endophytica]|uniref:AAA family ATPase n=1 Tax=Erwinia endophytica TaxID=1563158 RepID=UPI001957147C|nr:AAA family ATPase [Erwinia endophytica]
MENDGDLTYDTLETQSIGSEKLVSLISLFNHKGGVSKAITVFHLGWKIADPGKHVLVVDAGPQCN